MKDVTIHFDGACEPRNPGGYGACGYIVRVGDVEFTDAIGLGRKPSMTNNTAEWCALGYALKDLLDHIPGDGVNRLCIYGDSMLVVNQLSGKWGSKTEHLTKLRDRCRELIEQINPEEWSIQWIPREQNERADELSRKSYEQWKQCTTA